jgi:Papain-like cysteine protease AvrRpt2
MSATFTIVEVPGIVPALKQSKNFDCWAVVTTILISWREQMGYDVHTIMERLGSEYLRMYEDDTWLPTNKINEWILASGLVEENPQCYSQSKTRDILKEFGPIVFTTAQAENGLHLMHARIITGMQNANGANANGDCTISDTDATWILGLDPSNGHAFTLPYSMFGKELEHQPSDCYLFAQAVHMPAQSMFISNQRK